MMPKSLVCSLPQVGEKASPKRTWIPRGLDLVQALQLCNNSLDGNLSDYSTLTELQEALHIITSSGLFTSLIDSLWLPYHRDGSGNTFSNIYTGQLFNSSLWSTNQPGVNRDCVACEESGCHSEDCQA